MSSQVQIWLSNNNSFCPCFDLSFCPDKYIWPDIYFVKCDWIISYITATVEFYFLCVQFIGEQDYSHLFDLLLTFPSGSGPNIALSFNVSITDDSLLEFDEFFTVRATSMDSAVTFAPGRDTSTVNILDDDSVSVEIDLDNYSIREGDGLLEVCLNLIGQLGRDITIQLQNVDVTAQGMNFWLYTVYVWYNTIPQL